MRLSLLDHHIVCIELVYIFTVKPKYPGWQTSGIHGQALIFIMN